MSQSYEQIFLGPAEGKPLSGATLRDWAIEDALARAERIKADYVQKCLRVIGEVPYGMLITSEDVREKAGDPPSDVSHSVMAGILRKAASMKWIVCTNETRMARRASVHAKRLSLWRRI